MWNCKYQVKSRLNNDRSAGGDLQTHLYHISQSDIFGAGKPKNTIEQIAAN